MSTKSIFVGLAFVAFSVSAGQSLWAESFAEFLDRVERRDPKTKAICEIRSVDNRNGSMTLLNLKTEVMDGVAIFEFSRSSKSGNQVERFRFPLTDEVSREVKRINNYREMMSLKSKADAAINAYRVFVASDFRIRVGDTLETADIQMGMARKAQQNQGQWAGRTIYVYEDGLTIDCVEGVVQGAWRDRAPSRH